MCCTLHLNDTRAQLSALHRASRVNESRENVVYAEASSTDPMGIIPTIERQALLGLGAFFSLFPDKLTVSLSTSRFDRTDESKWNYRGNR
jgi:hypothetical protein